MTTFVDYSNQVFNAFLLHSKRDAIIDRKLDIIDKINDHYASTPDSILFVGFNPAILKVKANRIFVTKVNQDILNWIKANRPEVELLKENQRPDCVVAVDEYLTFARSEQDQLDKIKNLCNLASKLVITTVKDYKNQDFNDKEYSQPAIIKKNSKMIAFSELHEWSSSDRNSWTTHLYKLEDQSAQILGQYHRRSLFFKQLAKFAIDEGAKSFLVHKNIMFKSIVKKNYEHVISITF